MRDHLYNREAGLLAAGGHDESYDGPSLIGYRVFVEGLGKGKVTAFTRAKFGPSAHTVEFPGIVPGAASSTRQVKLRRKGNGETPWVVQLPTRVVVQESPEHEASAARERLVMRRDQPARIGKVNGPASAARGQ